MMSTAKICRIQYRIGEIYLTSPTQFVDITIVNWSKDVFDDEQTPLVICFI